jgi:hypothetical protein
MTSDQHLYRFWNGETLLYIGVSINAYARANQHRRDADWWPEADRMTIETFPDRAAVLAAEAAAIIAEAPRFNVAGNPRATPKKAVPFEPYVGRKEPLDPDSQAFIDSIVDQAPPLTHDQLATLGALLKEAR